MYALDADLAKEGSGSANGVITETGKYKGEIEWAREKRFDNGTIIVELRFKSDRGSANLNLFVNDYEGETSFGMKQLNALMACLKIRNIAPINGVIEAYDPDTRQVGPVQAAIFPELSGKKIGFLLEAQHSVYEGKPRVQMLIKAPFTHDTEQTAVEVLANNGKAETIEKMIPLLKDRQKGTGNNTQSLGHQSSASGAPDDLDDDIPF